MQDTQVTPLAHLADVVLAGATFAEKAGCYVNADGRLQYPRPRCPRATVACPTSMFCRSFWVEPARPVPSTSLPSCPRLSPLSRRPEGARSPISAFPFPGTTPDRRRRRFLDPWLGLGQTRAGRAIETNEVIRSL